MIADWIETTRNAAKRYFGEAGALIGFFSALIGLSNLLYRLFDIRLIPIVRIAFDTFHQWCHSIMHALVWCWLLPCLEALGFAIVWLASLVSSITLYWPHFTVPRIVADLALLSLALTRVLMSADVYVPREVRANAELQMTPELWREIEQVEGRFWGPIHRFFDRVNAQIWRLIDFAQGIITYPFRKHQKWVQVVRVVLCIVTAVALLWGFIRLVGYLINHFMARDLSSPMMIVRRRFMRFFTIHLAAATLAAGAFIVWNGWLAEFYE